MLSQNKSQARKSSVYTKERHKITRKIRKVRMLWKHRQFMQKDRLLIWNLFTKLWLWFISPVYSNKQVKIIPLIGILKYNKNLMTSSFKSHFSNANLCAISPPPVRTPLKRCTRQWVCTKVILYSNNRREVIYHIATGCLALPRSWTLYNQVLMIIYLGV